MRILAVGDSYMPPGYFMEAFGKLEAEHEIDYFQVNPEDPFTPERTRSASSANSRGLLSSSRPECRGSRCSWSRGRR